MFVATHTVIGAIIGTMLPTHPFIVFGLAFLLHFLTDMVPHGDTKLYKDHLSGVRKKLTWVYVIGDALVTICLIGYFIQISTLHIQPAVLTGILGSVLPDILVGLYEAFRTKWLARFHYWHFFFHNLISNRIGDLPLAIGVMMEMILTSTLFYQLL